MTTKTKGEPRPAPAPHLIPASLRPWQLTDPGRCALCGLPLYATDHHVTVVEAVRFNLYHTSLHASCAAETILTALDAREESE